MTFYESEIKRIREICYSNDKQIETVIALRDFIDKNINKDLNLDLLSQRSLTSKYHLLRLFKKYYGITPRQYIKDKRIEKAKKYLSDGMSVYETCVNVGFESLGSFSLLFKIKTGTSPYKYQKEQFSRNN